MNRTLKFATGLSGLYLLAVFALHLSPGDSRLRADDFHVNSTEDLPDLNPGDGFCSTGRLIGDEPEVTLRAAIMEANALPGRDKVYIPEGTYFLTLINEMLRDEYPHEFRFHLPRPSLDEIASMCSANDLDVAGETQLIGEGADRTIIDGLFLLNHRVLHVHGPTKIEGLKIRNGKALGFGGGIYVQRADYFFAEDVEVRWCNAAFGGGIAVHGGGSYNFRLTRCKIFANSARQKGGGIFVDSHAYDRMLLDSVWVDRNRIQTPSSSSHGSGIYLNTVNRSSSFRYLTIINNSTISRNGPGGAIFNNTSDLIMANSTISENEGQGFVNHYDRTKIGDPRFVQMKMCTVAFNLGFGVALDSRVPFQIGHTIVTGNRCCGGSPSHEMFGSDRNTNFFHNRDDDGLVQSLGHNIIWPEPGSFNRIRTTTDLSVDPKILRRFNHFGAFAPSHRLRYDSPAIDAGTTDPASLLRSLKDFFLLTPIYSRPLTDQKGTLRPFGRAVDIGAYEYDGPYKYDWDQPTIDRDILVPRKFDNKFDFNLKIDSATEMEGEADEDELEIEEPLESHDQPQDENDKNEEHFEPAGFGGGKSNHADQSKS